MIARAPVTVAPVMPFAVPYVNLSAAGQLFARAYDEPDPSNRLNPVEYPVAHTVPASCTATSTDEVAVTRLYDTTPALVVGYAVDRMFFDVPAPLLVENKMPFGSNDMPYEGKVQMLTGVSVALLK